MNITLPLMANESGGSSGGSCCNYETLIDGSLDFYSATLKNYPVANAWNDGINDSQEFRGLQGIVSRTNQNTARQGLLSFGIAQGIGNLSVHSILPTTKTIKKISSGNIQSYLYLQQNSYNIVNLLPNNSNIQNTENIFTFQHTYSYLRSGIYYYQGAQMTGQIIETLNGKRYIIYGVFRGIKLIEVDVNNNVIGSGDIFLDRNSFDLSTITYTGRIGINIICVDGDYIRLTILGGSGRGFNNNGFDLSLQNQLVRLNDDLTITTIHKTNEIINGVYTTDTELTMTSIYYGGGSYRYNNTCVFVSSLTGQFIKSYYNAGGMHSVGKIDLSDKTTFNYVVVSENSGLYNSLQYHSNIGYDNINDKILFVGTNLHIYEVDMFNNVVDTGQVYYGSFYYDFSSKTQGINELIDNTIGISTKDNKLILYGTECNGGLIKLSFNCLFIYDFTGSLKIQDECFVHKILMDVGNGQILDQNGLNLKVNLNGNEISNILFNNYINLNNYNNNILLNNIDINANKIDFELILENNNINPINCKIGFGLNGGTYDAPIGNYETSQLDILL